MAPVESRRPGRSTGGASGSREVGTAKATSSAATAANGTSAKKTLDQEKRSSSQPPMIGPTAIPTPVLAPQSPIARARSLRSVNTLVSNDWVAGKISAAPPITARAAISAPGRFPTPPAELDEESDEQHALAADPVAEVPGGEHERREHHVVGVDDPLELHRRGVKLAHQRRQRDVHDRRVEVDHVGRQ
jgi:hypothetical protein